ncbi:4-alpha-glucanotransferase (amylomaltase) [Pseudoalteromonas luteoviolacea B = ATCC 29581]|nr:4-alpha-glucanotransferase (amylomaltase) [Pseudoalteromonas luteoviolacea B = ATCC 29581]
MDRVEQAMYLHGVGNEFIKYTGEHVVFSHETRLKALECCEVAVDDASAIERHNFELDIASWVNGVPSISLVSSDDFLLKIKLPEAQAHTNVTVELTDGNVQTSQPQMHCFGEYHYQGIRYVEVGIKINALPVGYHQANITILGKTSQTEIWVVPQSAFYLKDTQKRLGLSIQLYTLNEENSFGIGDFAALRTLIAVCADSFDFILLNPLHELFPNQPERASPYSPSHRCFLNPLYIDVFHGCEYLGVHKNEKLFEEINALQKKSIITSTMINYTAVSELKFSALALLYQAYCDASSDLKRLSVEQYSDWFDAKLAPGQTILEPDAFQQWLAKLQLKACQSLAIEKGMAIGLVNDLAVGCADDGKEYQEYFDVFALGANVGAPPDPWAENGQDWGLPAPDPQRMKKNNFAYFKRLIRQNLADVGALRIDHVMAIRRLWWCFSLAHGERSGCYIYYPFDNLLAILKIESHLRCAMLIGEDLGVVPPEVRTALDEANIFSNILFYFEKDHSGQFVDPKSYRKDSLLMVANHDVPPFFGWWQNEDIKTKLHFQLIDDVKCEELKKERQIEKEKLCSWLGWHSDAQLNANSPASQVYQRLLFVLSASGAKWLTVQLDDLDEALAPVNIPGTNLEYPNWRRKLQHSVTTIMKNKKSLLTEIKSLRMVND